MIPRPVYIKGRGLRALGSQMRWCFTKFGGFAGGAGLGFATECNALQLVSRPSFYKNSSTMMFAADVICAHLRSSVRLHQRTSYSVIHLRVIRHRFRSSFLFKFFAYYFFQVYSGISLGFSFTRVACRCLCGSVLDLLIANRLQRALFGQSASSAVA